MAKDVHIAIGQAVGREDVVIGDDDYFLPIPHFCVRTEVFLENADGGGAADVMRHEDIGVNPDVIAGHDAGFIGMAGEDLFGHRHCWHLESLFGVRVNGSIN